MKIHINIVSLVIGVAWLSFMGGIAYMQVGELPECRPEPYTWIDSLGVWITFVCVYVMGVVTTMSVTLKDDE